MARAVAVAVWRTLLEIASPSRCSGCEQLLPRPAVFCPACASSVLPVPGWVLPVGDAAVQAVAFGAYGGALADGLRRYKYRDRPDLAAPLGELLRRRCREAGLAADLVVPVPLHPLRLAERGYDQAALLARPVARELAAPLAPRALRRTRPTSPQASLSRPARAANVAGAFRVSRPRAVAGRAVLLVDDVVTTGATVQSCAAALLAAGAAAVAAVAVARAAPASGRQATRG